MSLNLLRVAAGVKSIKHLRQVVDHYSVIDDEFGAVMPLTTRNRPKRQAELLDGGSVYWIVRGAILARAPLVGFREFTDSEGRLAVNMLIRPTVILTVPREKRGFQGWRYLSAADAPEDLGSGAEKHKSEEADDMPPAMYQELRSLGLL